MFPFFDLSSFFDLSFFILSQNVYKLHICEFILCKKTSNQFLLTSYKMANALFTPSPNFRTGGGYLYIFPFKGVNATAGTLNLNTADKIIFNGTRYKVMAVKDYSLNGFIEYQVILDFEGAPTNE